LVIKVKKRRLIICLALNFLKFMLYFINKSKNMKRILVLSLESIDRIFKKNEKTPVKEKGGPAFYIRRTLDDLGAGYRMAEYEPAEVEIRVTEHGEVGKILKPGKIKVPERINESNVLISTIGPSNLELDFLVSYTGDVFLDVQGFVRSEKSEKLGAKETWENIRLFIENILVLKGTSEELCFLPKDVLEKTKGKILLETRGKNGVVMYEKGRSVNLLPPKIIKARNTVGAGDTFMAAFVYKFIQTKNAKKAICFALSYTSGFLDKKRIS